MKISLETLGAGRYQLGDVLGHGATAVVVRGHDRDLDRDVAIKILAENLAADQGTRERFLREARTAARWSHPNLVQVFDVGDEGGRPFMVMECIEGPNLHEDLRARGRFPPDEVASIGIAVCGALSHIHEAGLVHRDLKPGNLLRTADGTVKMTDFGIALDPALTSLTEVGTMLGTVAYLAPERVDGAPASPAEDLYSLGVCLYEMLAGRPPYQATTLPELSRKQREEPTLLGSLVAGVPVSLERAITRCLARDPAERFASAADVARALVATPDATPDETQLLHLDDAATVLLRAPEPVAPGPATALLGPAPVRRRLAILVAGALGSLLLIGALIVNATSGGSPNAPASPAGTASPAAQGGGAAAESARDLADWIRSNTK